jgi:serine/threonine-protein kinase
MAAKVVLECTRGRLTGARYTFAERATCILGRSAECSPQIIETGPQQFISRYHCLLDINPPDVRVRDFGSLNGTFVNGVKIGQRSGERSARPGSPPTAPEHRLAHGDRLQVADCEFSVIVEVERQCDSCGRELLEEEYRQAQFAPGRLLCSFCRESAPREARATEEDGTRCASCRQSVPAGTTRTRHGEVLCQSCRENPEYVAERIIEGAATRAEPLTALAGYRIVRPLGQGGMSAVYLARNDLSGGEVALKVLLPQVAVNPHALKMFQREIAITRRMEHPNIVRLVDSGFANGAFFLCLDYCPGGSVQDLMDLRGGTLPVDEAAVIVEQVLDALEYAHGFRPHDRDGSANESERGVIHRDIKPTNMLLMKRGSAERVKLGDFGLSKAFDLSGLSGLTRTGETCGSPYFICRQQVLNYKYSKAEVDLWSTAAALYNMLTGAYPREFQKGRDIWQTILQDDPIPIRKRRPDLPGRVADFIDHALRDRPAIPFKNVGAFREAMRRAFA